MISEKTGFFISFEGNDGSGKTTQIRLLAQWFESRGRAVLQLREPGGTPIGEKVRDILLDNASSGMEPVTEMMLYAASRAQLMRTVIAPALKRGDVVICDRFVDSSYAYQGFGRELGMETVQAVNLVAIDGQMPHLTFFLDLDAVMSMARRNASGTEADRLENEKMDFHRRVYEGYLTLCAASGDRIKRIPVMAGLVQRTQEEVSLEIRDFVLDLLS